MKRCPITYEIINDKKLYSQRGLKKLSPLLTNLGILDYSAAEQRQEAVERAGKMSIQGVQTKLSAQLKVKEEKFELVDARGQYILKPQSEYYPELPENEAITMTLAEMIGIEIPIHGLLYSKDNSMTYFIKRFDRFGHNKKYALEDFGQLQGLSRDNKYKSSMEKIAKTLQFCSAPKIEAPKLFKLTLFNFLIGNEDMHVKNFSLITRENRITLSPAYDLLNSTIALNDAQEELALPLNGKKRNLLRKDIFDYFAIGQLEINKKVIDSICLEINNAIPEWKILITHSFLSKTMQEKFLNLLDSRYTRLF